MLHSVGGHYTQSKRMDQRRSDHQDMENLVTLELKNSLKTSKEYTNKLIFPGKIRSGTRQEYKMAPITYNNPIVIR